MIDIQYNTPVCLSVFASRKSCWMDFNNTLWGVVAYFIWRISRLLIPTVLCFVHINMHLYFVGLLEQNFKILVILFNSLDTFYRVFVLYESSRAHYSNPASLGSKIENNEMFIFNSLPFYRYKIMVFHLI